MKLTEQHSYSAEPAAVWAMLTDPAFQTEVSEAIGATSHDVAIDADDDGGTITVTRVLPANVPDFARKFVGETLTVVQTETWGPADGDGNRRADVRLDVQGQPAGMTSVHALSPAGRGAVLDIEGEIKVKIPIVGGKLERELLKGVSAGLRVEQEVGQRYLS